jgi:DNA primase
MTDQVDEIKGKVDIVGVINTRVELKRAGKYFKGVCPFHAERTPSFFVSPEMQMYKCFGCGASGDVFSFLEAYEGISFREALEELAKKAGVELSRQAPTKGEIETKRIFEILDLAREYYAYVLENHPTGEKARQYLEKRLVAAPFAKAFNLGWAPDSWRSLTNFLVGKKNYTLDEAEKSGLVIKGSQGGGYDRFRGRVMFPLTDFRGRVVGFSGRTIDPEVKEAKYVNTPETSVYHKRELLFGITQAKTAIRKKDRVVVVEGEFDVISSYIAGVRNVVGIKGSAVTEDQLKTLMKLTRNISLCLDADAAGEAAMKRGIEIADHLGLSVAIIPNSGGKDPDEVARSSREEWKKMVTKNISAYQFYIDSAFARYDNNGGEGKKKISEELVPILSKIGNSVEQIYYLKVVAKRLGVGEEAVKSEMEKYTRAKQLGRVEVREEKRPEGDRETMLEKYVWGLWLQLTGEPFGKTAEKLVDREWVLPGLQKLAVNWRERLAKGEKLDLPAWVRDLPAEIGGLIGEAYLSPEVMKLESEEEIVNQIKGVLEELDKLKVKKEINVLTNQIQKLEDVDELTEVQERELEEARMKTAQLLQKLH